MAANAFPQKSLIIVKSEEPGEISARVKSRMGLTVSEFIEALKYPNARSGHAPKTKFIWPKHTPDEIYDPSRAVYRYDANDPSWSIRFRALGCYRPSNTQRNTEQCSVPHTPPLNNFVEDHSEDSKSDSNYGKHIAIPLPINRIGLDNGVHDNITSAQHHQLEEDLQLSASEDEENQTDSSQIVASLRQMPCSTKTVKSDQHHHHQQQQQPIDHIPIDRYSHSLLSYPYLLDPLANCVSPLSIMADDEATCPLSKHTALADLTESDQHTGTNGEHLGSFICAIGPDHDLKQSDSHVTNITYLPSNHDRIEQYPREEVRCTDGPLHNMVVADSHEILASPTTSLSISPKVPPSSNTLVVKKQIHNSTSSSNIHENIHKTTEPPDTYPSSKQDFIHGLLKESQAVLSAKQQCFVPDLSPPPPAAISQIEWDVNQAAHSNKENHIVEMERGCVKILPSGGIEPSCKLSSINSGSQSIPSHHAAPSLFNLTHGAPKVDVDLGTRNTVVSEVDRDSSSKHPGSCERVDDNASFGVSTPDVLDDRESELGKLINSSRPLQLNCNQSACRSLEDIDRGNQEKVKVKRVKKRKSSNSDKKSVEQLAPTSESNRSIMTVLTTDSKSKHLSTSDPAGSDIPIKQSNPLSDLLTEASASPSADTQLDAPRSDHRWIYSNLAITKVRSCLQNFFQQNTKNLSQEQLFHKIRSLLNSSNSINKDNSSTSLNDSRQRKSRCRTLTGVLLVPQASSTHTPSSLSSLTSHTVIEHSEVSTMTSPLLRAICDVHVQCNAPCSSSVGVNTTPLCQPSASPMPEHLCVVCKSRRSVDSFSHQPSSTHTSRSTNDISQPSDLIKPAQAHSGAFGSLNPPTVKSLLRLGEECKTDASRCWKSLASAISTTPNNSRHLLLLNLAALHNYPIQFLRMVRHHISASELLERDGDLARAVDLLTDSISHLGHIKHRLTRVEGKITKHLKIQSSGDQMGQQSSAASWLQLWYYALVRIKSILNFRTYRLRLHASNAKQQSIEEELSGLLSGPNETQSDSLSIPTPTVQYLVNQIQTDSYMRQASLDWDQANVLASDLPQVLSDFSTKDPSGEVVDRYVLQSVDDLQTSLHWQSPTTVHLSYIDGVIRVHEMILNRFRAGNHVYKQQQDVPPSLDPPKPLNVSVNNLIQPQTITTMTSLHECALDPPVSSVNHRKRVRKKSQSEANVNRDLLTSTPTHSETISNGLLHSTTSTSETNCEQRDLIDSHQFAPIKDDISCRQSTNSELETPTTSTYTDAESDLALNDHGGDKRNSRRIKHSRAARPESQAGGASTHSLSSVGNCADKRDKSLYCLNNTETKSSSSGGYLETSGYHGSWSTHRKYVRSGEDGPRAIKNSPNRSRRKPVASVQNDVTTHHYTTSPSPPPVRRRSRSMAPSSSNKQHNVIVMSDYCIPKRTMSPTNDRHKYSPSYSDKSDRTYKPKRVCKSRNTKSANRPQSPNSNDSFSPVPSYKPSVQSTDRSPPGHRSRRASSMGRVLSSNFEEPSFEQSNVSSKKYSPTRQPSYYGKSFDQSVPVYHVSRISADPCKPSPRLSPVAYSNGGVTPRPSNHQPHMYKSKDVVPSFYKQWKNEPSTVSKTSATCRVRKHSASSYHP